MGIEERRTMDTKNGFKICTILGVDIAVTNMESFVEFIEHNINTLRGKYICVSNVHTTVMAYEDKSYCLIQNSSYAAIPDGKPLAVVSKKRGFIEAERVTGPDLMGALFERNNGIRHFFYGDTTKTLQLLQEKLRIQYPDIKIAGVIAPPFRQLTQEEENEYIDKIIDSKADIVWVGLGAPKQERWMYEHRNMFPGVMIGVGAGFSYHAGLLKRAPMWMQKMSLEWLYRLLQDPARLAKRYFSTNFKFIWLVFKENIRKHK